MPLTAKLRVNVKHHRAQAIGREGGNEVHGGMPATIEEVGKGAAESIEAQAPSLSLVENDEVGVKARQ